MPIPKEFQKDVDALPPLLRALLDAELAAGNQIVDVGHSFPAPPIGAYLKMARAITTHPRDSVEGLSFRDYNSSLYSGEFTDSARRYFILEPPEPQPAEPDMEATPPPVLRAPAKSDPETPLQRFESSMILDYDQWHDGIGYDLDALRSASPKERAAIESKLIRGGVNGWRDVEALAEIDSPSARAALEKALAQGSQEIKMAVLDRAPHLVPEPQRIETLVNTLRTAVFYGGLSQAIDEAAAFHPPEVVKELFHGALHREAEVAVHFAALLTFIHGKAKEPFDMAQRPFFLKFHTTTQAERETVFSELCHRIGVPTSPYL